jgi:hypothetical protein
MQLSYLFLRSDIHLVFIGPESMLNRDSEFPLPERTAVNPFGGIVEDRLGGRMKITTYVEYFHTMHEAKQFYPYDPYFDCFMLFHPGLGHPASAHEWQETIPQLLETKVPIICTGYTEWDMQRDVDWVTEQCGGEMDLLMEPGENIFRSLRWDLNDLDPQDLTCGNWGVWAFRGKRYVLFPLQSIRDAPIPFSASSLFPCPFSSPAYSFVDVTDTKPHTRMAKHSRGGRRDGQWGGTPVIQSIYQEIHDIGSVCWPQI